ncbi:Ditrans,polycis-undecaprenyl-diphosphate synthase ((2E,6E)-farnesyl-diphosphate specific) [Vibrio stylophorae]|uniref:Ditrans,polycis-undecaprenyl-diphosphate synthase ((2E,6E)-farnesyl-diphosphate specific) n=1 Tax=Vibrio stylophorae TaxID=659351 RepID=A0ABN8DW25_9VIBR|nr:polyprenyl diphosphate synthase [Vibrio stylophorae]CAH0534232.1 Ditrans,polycis-undecaprenyl-diphosphate synthase ((2E,6E)-farnesyl-diphosphate specific) [Vibrio stylophorae]
MTDSSPFSLEKDALPKHIAIIMDGNGRWAKARGKARISGHRAGALAVRRTVSTAAQLGIQALTLFAFSSENWRRPQDEVDLLMKLFLHALQREVKKLHKHQIKLQIIGDLSNFSPALQKQIAKAQALTANNQGLVLNIAANYGGKWDIVQAAQQLATAVERGELDASQVDESTFAKALCLSDLPDVDLMIRTSGEQRISNFLLWQMAYAELYFTSAFWPDFDEHRFAEAIAWYVNRERRFGCTGEQISQLLTTASE